MWEMRNEKWDTRSLKWGNGKQERCWIGPWEVGNETRTRILIFEILPSDYSCRRRPSSSSPACSSTTSSSRTTPCLRFFKRLKISLVKDGEKVCNSGTSQVTFCQSYILMYFTRRVVFQLPLNKCALFPTGGGLEKVASINDVRVRTGLPPKENSAAEICGQG